MTTLQARSYSEELDLVPLVELLAACEAVDQLGWGLTLEELRGDLNDGEVDHQHDLRVWLSDAGAIEAFGEVRLRQAEDQTVGTLWMLVRPDRRDGELEREVFNWAAGRVREVGVARGLPMALHTGYLEQDSWRSASAAAQGLTPLRTLNLMLRTFTEPIAEPVLPAGYSLRRLAGEQEIPAWVEMYNESFVDHWSFKPLTVQQRLHWHSEPGYRADGDLVVVAPDGTLAAFCVCDINDEENQRLGRNEGWIPKVGTRRGYRQQGLARAALLAGLRWYQSLGLDGARLSVDTESVTGALRLYQSVGFRMVECYVVAGTSLS